MGSVPITLAWKMYLSLLGPDTKSDVLLVLNEHFLKLPWQQLPLSKDILLVSILTVLSLPSFRFLDLPHLGHDSVDLERRGAIPVHGPQVCAPCHVQVSMAAH